MDRYEKHLFVCLNERDPDNPKGCCQHKGSEEVFRAFRKQLSERGLKERFKASKAGCLASCENGITVVVYPEGVWYKQVTVDDVLGIIDEHLLQNRPVTSLRLFPQDKPGDGEAARRAGFSQ
jgi:(2Fe-2S) ferredoxin